MNILQKFGDVDMSSGKNMFMSLRHSTASKGVTPPSVAPAVPSAFAQKKNAFAPPPVRHVSATSPPPSRSSSGVDSPAAASPSPPPAPPARPKPEPAGEWADALYEYSSDVRILSLFRVLCILKLYGQDPGDLTLQENDRVLVVEKPSDDWSVYATSPRVTSLIHFNTGGWVKLTDGVDCFPLLMSNYCNIEEEEKHRIWLYLI